MRYFFTKKAKSRMTVLQSIHSPLGAYVITSKDHIKIAEAACQGGARIIQYRDKESSRKNVLETADKLREITRRFNSLFIVNDFIDVALLCEADGVHLGQDDIPAVRAREITSDNFIIGVSTHSLEQALMAEKKGVDYIGIGPVFSTPTKENYSPIGVSVVRKVIENVSIPVMAIGGVNLENLEELIEIGCKNVAMLRAFQENTAERVKRVNFLLKV
jgi:thiamine-phosphate pyrophosphorylase